MTLKEARLKRKLTQDELSALSGVTQANISSIERGETDNPRWETVVKLCDALRVNPRDIFPVETAGVR